MSVSKNKKAYPLRLHESKKKVIDEICRLEGYTFNGLIEHLLDRKIYAYTKIIKGMIIENRNKEED